MLNELDDLQSSNESMWGAPRVSFTIETREPVGGELVQREYTFSHAKEWDKWTFFEYEERRTDDTKRLTDRNWRRSRKIHWQDAEAFPEIPEEVEDELKELLEVEELNIQNY